MATSRSLGPGFRALLAGSFVSNLGDGVRLAALPLLATSLTTSPVLVASVTAAQYLPWLVFGPVGGALVDRSDRRRAILATQAWRGALLLGLAALVGAEVVEVWHVCVVALLVTAGEILVDPATVALVPTLYEQTWKKTQRPKEMAGEFATQSNWYRIGRLYADKLTDAGDNQKAQAVLAELKGQPAANR